MYKKKISYKTCIQLILSFSVSVSVCAAWFYFRNIQLYNDVFLSSIEMQTVPYYVDVKSIFSFYLLYPFIPGLFGSFWGVFGWMNVALPFLIYVLLFLFCASIVLFSLKKITLLKFSNEKILFAVLSIVFCLMGVVYYNLSYSQHQGRFLFPVISFISIFLVYGIKNAAEKFKREKLIYVSIVIFFVLIDVISLVTIERFYYDLSKYL